MNNSIEATWAPEQDLDMEKVGRIANELREKVLKSKSFKEVVEIVGEYYAFNTDTSSQLTQWFGAAEEAVESEFKKDEMSVSKVNSPKGMFYCAVDKNGTPKRRLLTPWSDFEEFRDLVSGIDDELHVLYFLKAFDRQFHPHYFIRLFLMGEFCFMSLNVQ